MIRYRLRQSLARALVAHLRRDFGPECLVSDRVTVHNRSRCATCQAHAAAHVVSDLYHL